MKQAKVYQSPVAAGIPFDNSTNGFVSDDVQDAIEELTDTFVGKGFQTTFLGKGELKNKWMENEDSHIESNQTPNIFKYESRLVGIDYQNKKKNSDPIILIAISDYGAGNTISRSYKWTLNNVRVAMKTNQFTGFTINAGDKMAVYVKDNGGDPRDLVVTMDFLVTDAPATELSENFNQYFEFNDFPPIGDIPEIFT